jgi:predicted DNA-binding transcriptional regulator AlpA
MAATTMRAVRPGEVPTVAVPDPDAVGADALSAVIVQLAALQARAAARLLAQRPRPPDRLLDAEETAARLRTTVDWLSRQKHLPFRVQLGPGQIRYSEQGLDAWIAGRRGGDEP